MSWKQIAKSKDLIIFEKVLKNYKFKIEARKNNNIWEIYKTKIQGETSKLLLQFKVTDEELNEIIKNLKRNIKIEKGFINKPINLIVKLKRVFKDEFTEKWEISINNDDKNFVLINFENDLYADIILNKYYKPYEAKILNEIKNSLAFYELSNNIYIKIYYYENSISYDEEKEIFFPFDEGDFDY